MGDPRTGLVVAGIGWNHTLLEETLTHRLDALQGLA